MMLQTDKEKMAVVFHYILEHEGDNIVVHDMYDVLHAQSQIFFNILVNTDFKALKRIKVESIKVE